MIPGDPVIEAAVLRGEKVFAEIGCVTCHVPSLPLENPAGRSLSPAVQSAAESAAGVCEAGIDGPDQSNAAAAAHRAGELGCADHLLPRVHRHEGARHLRARGCRAARYESAGVVAAVPRGQSAISDEAGYGARPTKRRTSITASTPRCGRRCRRTRAKRQTRARHFASSRKYDQDSVIEFLKTLQVLPPGSSSLIVDERFRRACGPPPGAPGSSR